MLPSKTYRAVLSRLEKAYRQLPQSGWQMGDPNFHIKFLALLVFVENRWLKAKGAEKNAIRAKSKRST